MELRSEPISAYKIKLMVALNLPRVHYLRKRRADNHHEKGIKDVELLCICISLICIKAEKLVKLGSDKLLQVFNEYNSNQCRLQDKMHHYQTSLPESEKQIYESEKALNTRKHLFLKKLMRSARHEQIIKQAHSMLDHKLTNLRRVGPILENFGSSKSESFTAYKDALVNTQVSTLMSIVDYAKQTLLKEFQENTKKT